MVTPQHFSVMLNISLNPSEAVLGKIIACLILKITSLYQLDAIPTVGSSTWLGSWWAGINFITHATEVIQVGYAKAAPFKVATLYRWMVIVSGPLYSEEIRKSRDDELSFLEATNDSMKVEYTLGHNIHHNPYHIPIIRSQLTRNLGVLYPDIRDELVTAFEETLDLKGNEWKSVLAFNTIQQVVCRTSNRIFVGLPLCRNSDWVDLSIKFTLDVVKGAFVIGLFPKFMAPLVARFMTSIPGSTRRAMKHLRPIVEERQKSLDEYGDAWAGKPKDILSWLMDEAEGSERTLKSLTQRVLTLNFVAIHASVYSFTQALCNLAANPQYIQPLREEVESIVKTEGWSRGSLAKMRKIDSFLKESQRMEGIDCLGMTRKAMKDFMFSDGTVIPKGTIVAIASRSTQFDDKIYENADMFDPFRFANMRDEDGEGVKHQFVSTGPEYLPFGHGKHACPGRFFAANELKSMLAHIVMWYDIKLEDGASSPQCMRIGTAIAADPNAKVVFRKRVY
ncbi:cytochrome P450 [Melanogaster broomeanus]|nr:cytochrome P450 [Melanogaster broomeanus]